MYRQVVFLTILIALALADLTCRDYIPKTWKSNQGKILVNGTAFPEDPKPRTYPYLPANASVGNPWQVGSKQTPGATFQFRTCNSSSIGVSSFTASDCGDSSCFRGYYDYLQVINPSTGHCLTIRDWNTTVSNLYFTNCGTNNKNTSQLWFATQTIDYSQSFGHITGYEPLSLDVAQKGPQDDGVRPFFSLWISETDNKTLQVIEYAYEDRGVYMYLEKVK